jgi:hypothetical protein
LFVINRNLNFGAAPSAAGYFYQARLALLLCINYVNTESSVQVAIERLDDISFEENGTPLELLQTKHHVKRIASLTDNSADLWKTLRVWSNLVAEDPSLPSRIRLVLVTTGNAPDNQAASLLRPAAAYPAGFKRDPKAAETLLTEVASTSDNKALSEAFEAYLSLNPATRASLLSAIEIVDNHIVLGDLDQELERALRLVAPSGKARQAREMLEGWWWPRVCSTLMSSPASAISIMEVEAKIDDIRDLLKREALVLDFEDAEPSEKETREYDGFRFIKQLKVIGIGGNRLQYAKRDYYRAFSQRSKWTREHAVFDGEIARFEITLLEEWEPRFSAMCDSLGRTGADASALMQAGQEIYQWMTTEARFPFRSVTTRFLSVGSYHILANDLRVGWHRDYLELCFDGQAE